MMKMHFIRREPYGFELCQVVEYLDGSTRVDLLFSLGDTSDLAEAYKREGERYDTALAQLDGLRKGHPWPPRAWSKAQSWDQAKAAEREARFRLRVLERVLRGGGARVVEEEQAA